jgi:hypothetical protein
MNRTHLEMVSALDGCLHRLRQMPTSPENCAAIDAAEIALRNANTDEAIHIEVTADDICALALKRMECGKYHEWEVLDDRVTHPDLGTYGKQHKECKVCGAVVELTSDDFEDIA